MNVTLLVVLFFASLLTGCFTIQSKSEVDYSKIGDVSGSSQANDKEAEFGGISTIETGFLFMPCSRLCSNAVKSLLEDSRDMGGNALIDVTFEGKKNAKSKTAMCLTRWSLIDLLVVPIFSPWKKKCRVEGIAVKRRINSTKASDLEDDEDDEDDETSDVKETLTKPDIIKKAKKCQEKGGVWVNDSCQISVD